MNLKITTKQKKFLIKAANHFLNHPDRCESFFCHYLESQAEDEGMRELKTTNIIYAIADEWKYAERVYNGKPSYVFILLTEGFEHGSPSDPMRRKFVRFFLKHIRATTPTT